MDCSDFKEDIEKQLECPVCLLRFTSPKVLECMHTFCQNCLAHVSKRNSYGYGVVIRCPTCRQKTRIEDVSKLHTNFIVQGIIDTLANVVTNCKSRSSKNIEEDRNSKACGKDDDEVKECNENVSPVTDRLRTPPDTQRNEPPIFHFRLTDSISYSSSVPRISRDANENPAVNSNALFSSENNLTRGFHFTPSFNFGNFENTSFAAPPPPANISMSNTQGYDFSCSTYQSIVPFGTLDKTSFSEAATSLNSTDECSECRSASSNANTDCQCIQTLDNAFQHLNINSTNLCVTWGSLEKTSFFES